MQKDGIEVVRTISHTQKQKICLIVPKLFEHFEIFENNIT